MKTIWKYALSINVSTEVSMPGGADLRAVAVQGDNNFISLWAEVDPMATPQTRHFFVVGTGHEFAGGARYVGTALDRDGFVWHVYERD